MVNYQRSKKPDLYPVEEERVTYHIQAAVPDARGFTVWQTVCRPYFDTDFDQARKHLSRMKSADTPHRLVRIEVMEIVK